MKLDYNTHVEVYFIFQDIVHLELWDNDKGQGISIGMQLVKEGWASSLLDEEVDHIKSACKLHAQNFPKQDPSINNQNSASACPEKIAVVGNANTSCSLKVSEVHGSCCLDNKHLKPSLSKPDTSESKQQDLGTFEVQDTLPDPGLLTKLLELFTAVFKLQVYKMFQDGNKRCRQPTESTSTTILPVGSSNFSTNEDQPQQKSTHCPKMSECHLSHNDGNEINSLEAIQTVNTVNEPSSLENIHSSGIPCELINCSSVHSNSHQSETSQYTMNSYNLKSTPSQHTKCSAREDVSFTSLECMRDVCLPQETPPEPSSMSDSEHLNSVKGETDETFYSYV